MTAFLKIYSNANCTIELAHTTDVATTISHTGGYAAGVSAINVASTTNMPTTGGYIDIIDATNGNESIPYTSISGNTINLAIPTAFIHPNSCVVNEWYYSIAVGDQSNGIVNDGSNATPDANNTNEYWLSNAGTSTAQNVVIATSSGAPSTGTGYNDTVISIAGATTGFAQSLNVGSINIGNNVPFWACAQVPAGQALTGNPQICDINMSYQSV